MLFEELLLKANFSETVDSTLGYIVGLASIDLWK